ncbi:hypothetical protein DL770_008179 [Monosporascus sp. CRB-9-2]|nr:hypothetical protein DL770_008179 [Monosporascus sp. CRB-9-2]
MDLWPGPARGDSLVGEAVPKTKPGEVVSATTSTWSPRQPKASTTVAAKEVPPTPGESEKTASHFEATTAGGEKIQSSAEIPADKEPHDASENANPDSSRGERPQGVRWGSQGRLRTGNSPQVPNIERRHSIETESVDNPATGVNEVLEESAPGSRAKIPEYDYTLKPLWWPDSARHYLDIVAVHDFDETTASWTYADISGFLRQGGEDSQKKTHKVGEESEEASLGSPESPMLGATTPKADPSKHKRESLEGDPTMTMDSVLDPPGEIREPENSHPRRSGSQRSFSPAGRIVGTNWLKDPQMMPRLLPGARILAFSYPILKPKSIGNKGEQAEYIDNAAFGLRRELEKARPSIDYDNIPIVFIAAGFGGMVVQKAITMAATPNNTSNDGPSCGAVDMAMVPEQSSLGLDHLANVVFLDTPFPRTFPKRPESQGLQAIALHPICWTDLRRLTNFPGPTDSGYRQIATHIRNDLMFTAVRNRKFQKLQAGLVKSGATVDNKDEWGNSLLHRATAAVNPVGVRILLRSHANPVIRDPKDQTPLHCAVNLFRLACDCKTDDTIPGVKERRELEDIIRVLLDSTRKSELKNSSDKQSNLPQDLLYHEGGSPCPANVCKHSEILELFKYHQPKVSRRLGEFEEPWKAWKPPRGEAQSAACKGSRTIVAEFYEDRLPPEYEVPSVHELVYQLDKGPVTIFAKLAGTMDPGSTVFNRYMVAQAKRYPQVVYKWTRTEQIRRREKRASRQPTWSDESDDERDAQSDQNSGADEHDRHSEFSLKAKHRPIIMVDQLWLWILADGTIVTSLPNTADASQVYNIKHSLEVAFFDNKSNSPIQSTNDLVRKVLTTCVDFFNRDGPCGIKFQECFRSSISDIAETEMNLYKEYSRKVAELENLGSYALQNESLIDSFSQIKQETDSLREIMDIQDELSIVDSILATQKVTLETLKRDVLGRGDGGKPAKPSKLDSNEDAPETAKTATPDSSCVQQAVRIVEANIKAVLEMKNSASRVQVDLKQLLDFKQQQANALETRFSRRLAEQGQKQNSIMLVFTIVTIVFLPLSFFASFFALNVQEFPKNSSGDTDWPLRMVASYLCRRQQRRLENPLLLGGEVVDSESEESDSSDNGGARAGRKPDEKPNHDASSSTSSRRSITAQWSIDEEDDEYARFFGLRGFTLHTKIPLVRRLWEYSIYCDTEFAQLDSGLEPFDWDYPLSRWYKKSLRFINKVRRRTNFEEHQGIEATSREAVLRMLQVNDEMDDVIRVLQEERSEVVETQPVLQRVLSASGLRLRRPGRESGDVV